MSAAAQPSHDRNLLFGMLALQLDFITRDQLIDALHAWVLAKDKPLAQLLTERGSLAAARRTLLEALVHEHLARHQDDPQQSLASLSATGSFSQALKQIQDEDVQASLRHVTADHSPTTEDAHATRDHTPTASPGPSRYRVLRPHARGGLGEVFVARDEELQREVALKEIQDRHADDPGSRARFVLEAEVTGGLEHPGIVPVYGLGAYADGRPYYAMRFIRGDSLKDAIKRFHEPGLANRAPGERALELRGLLGRFIDVCNALAYAHSRGVLHRDLKPGNIMLGKYGETLVVDWGLAKTLGQAEPGTDSERPLTPAVGQGATPTMMGALIGTPAYMSPEQAAGRLDLLGPASDLYSLGATLYHLLTGQPPVTGQSKEEVIRKAERGEIVPPRQVQPHTPPALAAVCLKALALRPTDRYASALALAADVEHWLADEPVSAWPEPLSVRAYRWVKRHRTSVTGAVAAVTVAAVVLAGATVLLTAAYESEATARHQEQAARVEAVEQRNLAKTQRDAAIRAKQEESTAKAEESLAKLDAQTQKAEAILQRDKARQYFARAQDAVDNMLTRVSEDKELLRHEPRMEEIRRKLLEDALAYYQGFLKEKSTDPGLRKETAHAHHRLARVQDFLGRTEEAERSNREALLLRRQLAEEFPEVPEYRSGQAQSLSQLATQLQRLGQTAEAEAAIREALKLQQQLADALPRVAEYQDGLAHNHTTLGVLLEQTGRAGKAEESYRAALRLQRQLAADFPEVADYRTELAVSHNNLGLLLERTGRTPQAEESYAEALKLRQRLADDFPRVAEYRDEAANSHHNLAVLLEKTGRAGGAEQSFREALGQRRRLVDDFPGVPKYRIALALTHNDLSVLLERAGREQEAEDMLRAALKLHQQLVGDFPKVQKYHRDLANSHNNLAVLQEKFGHYQKAEASHRAALKLLQRLADDFPELPDYRRALGLSQNNLAVLLHNTGGVEESEELYRAALKLRRQLADDFPEVAEHRYDLSTTYNNLAFLFEKTGRLPQALETHQEALKLWRQLTTDLPKVPTYRRGLALSHGHLGSLLEQTGRAPEAETSYRAALKLQQPLADDFPKVPDYQNGLALLHTNLAVLLQRVDRDRESEVSCRAALKLFQRLVDDFPTIPDYRMSLASAQNNLGFLLAKAGKVKEAEQAYRSALNSRHRLLEDFPKNQGYRAKQALDYHRLADFLNDEGQLPEAEKMYQAAITLRTQLAGASPKNAALQAELATSLNNLGMLVRDRPDLAAAKKYIEQAAVHNQAALTLAPEHAAYRTNVARSHTNLANLQVRLNNHREAAQAAAEVLRVAPTTWEEYYQSARFTCLAIPLASKDAVLTDALRKDTLAAYGAQAVRLLQQAVVQGYTDAAALKKEPAFAPLLDRPDFQQLLKALQVNDRLWEDLLDAKQTARYQFAETRHEGTLTAQKKSQSHPLEFKAGTTYVLDAESKAFDTMLILEDAAGKRLAFNDDITPKNLNSRIIFTAAQGGTYRVVVTSYEQAGTGAYVLRVRTLVKRPVPE